MLGELMSAVFLPLIGIVRGRIDGRASSTLIPVPEGIVRREGFTLPPHELIVYGALIAVAALQLAGFVAGFAGGAFLEEGDSVLPLVVVANVFGSAIIIYLLGAWFGSRARTRPLLTLIAAMLTARALGTIIDFVALPAASFEDVYEQERTWGFFAVSLAGALVFALVFTLVFGFLGIWRGRRMQEAAYFQYLIRRLPERDREALVSMAYEGATQVTPPQPQHQLQPST